MRWVTSVNRVLRKFGVQVVRSDLGVGPRRIRASLAAFEACHGRVVAGPFAGMAISDRFTWGDANIGAVALGCYEEQLHGCIEELIAASPDLLVNVGSAEGTYAVGFALRLPHARVLAVDVEAQAGAAVSANAGLNSVEQRIEFHLGLTPQDIEGHLAKADRPALMIDCEGCEVEYVDLLAVPSLSRTLLLIELHPLVRPGVRELLLGRLGATHEVDEIVESGRNPHAHAELRPMPSIDKWLVVCEGREETMTWLWCRPREGIPGRQS